MFPQLLYSIGYMIFGKSSQMGYIGHDPAKYGDYG
jgi:hypothetical protein